MALAFDLISDLHMETWEGDFDWSHRATSPYCVVAGDVCRDRGLLIDTLTYLGRCYQAVFYIDGNDEHFTSLANLNASYNTMAKEIEAIPNVVYLQDNVVVVDGVAFLGTNGWWGFDLDLTVDPTESAIWYQQKQSLSSDAVKRIARMSTTDANYMISSVRRLQTHPDVKKIVLVTHTVPSAKLIEHDIELDGTYRFNQMGNSFMKHVFAQDTEQKIHTWCFGHYHKSIDQIDGYTRYVNNCKGRGDTPYNQYVYHPKRIIVDLN